MLKCWHFVSRSSQRCLLSGNPGLSRQMALLSTVNDQADQQQDESSAGKVTRNPDEVLKNILGSIRKDMSSESLVQVMVRLTNDLPTNVTRPLAAKALDEERDPCAQADKLQQLFVMFEDIQKMDKLPAKAIITCHKSVTRLGLNSKKSKAVQTLENRLTWKARNVPMKELPHLLSYAHKVNQKGDALVADSSNSSTASVLFTEIIRVIEARWVEVDNVELLCSFLYYYPSIFSEQFVRNLEDKAMEMSEHWTGQEIIKVLKTLGQKKRRNVPLVRKLTYHLQKRLMGLDLRSFCDILFTLNQLSFKANGTLLSEACYEAEKLIDLDTPAASICSLLTSMGQLKMLEKELLNKISQHLMGKITSEDHQVTDRELYAFALTCATVNYSPKDSDPLFEVILQRITRDKVRTDFGPKHDLLWLDFVWSLCILNKATNEVLASVLSPDFYNKILYSQYNRNVGLMLKLLNVNGYASLLCGSNYTGPKIETSYGSGESEVLMSDVRGPVLPDKKQIVRQVMDAVASLAPSPTFLAADVNTGMGFNVEGEAVFDKNIKPLKIDPYKMLHSSSSAAKAAPIPPDSNRVALMVVGYHDCLLGGQDLNGLTDLHLRLLRAKGFNVLIVKHSDIKPGEKTLDRVKMIQQKLKTLLEAERK